jgi:hypothetical protein
VVCAFWLVPEKIRENIRGEIVCKVELQGYRRDVDDEQVRA